MLVSLLLSSVSELLQDADRVTWTEPQLLEWVNDGTRALVLVRPDASDVTVTQLLVPGTKQTLSGVSDLRLLRVIRNMGTDGATPGRAIRGPTAMNDMDAADPDWHTKTAQTAVREYVFDPLRPKEFWTNPPVHAATLVYVELQKAVLPTNITAIGNTLPVDDVYAPALIEWVMYRAYARESEKTPGFQKAVSHFKAFFNLLGVKTQADMAVDPRVREQVKK